MIIPNTLKKYILVEFIKDGRTSLAIAISCIREDEKFERYRSREIFGLSLFPPHDEVLGGPQENSY